jgi:DNA-directed RNA polymerase omega subunit
MNNQTKAVVKNLDANAPKTQKRELTESNFELVILAAQRCRQLVNGATPHIAVPDKNPRNTYTAIKEVELGLISFKGNYDE